MSTSSSRIKMRETVRYLVETLGRPAVIHISGATNHLIDLWLTGKAMPSRIQSDRLNKAKDYVSFIASQSDVTAAAQWLFNGTVEISDSGISKVVSPLRAIRDGLYSAVSESAAQLVHGSGVVLAR